MGEQLHISYLQIFSTLEREGNFADNKKFKVLYAKIKEQEQKVCISFPVSDG
jgi:hypothetical protein